MLRVGENGEEVIDIPRAIAAKALTNLSDGGEGMVGHAPSLATREKMARSQDQRDKTGEASPVTPRNLARAPCMRDR